MRRKLVIICMAACMLCLAIGCGTGKDNNVADESTSATNNNSSAELKKTDTVSEPETKSQGLFHQIHKEVTFCGLPHAADA